MCEISGCAGHSPQAAIEPPVINRRRVLSGMAALGASASGLAAFVDPTLAQTAAPTAAPSAPKPHRIDIHHHFSPPQWIAEVKGRENLQRANSDWTPARSIEDMDQAGVAAAVVSVTNPGLWFGDKEVTKRISRECNDYGAKLMQQHPTRFGLFAAMPLPDVDATLKEIEYAYDVLKADGIHLFTSYGDVWLGNAAFEPVMAELNRRKAVVHVHPTAANCCKNLVPDVPPGIMEYGTDTTRAILGLMFSGQAVKFPDIRWIWSHAGGTAPMLVGRIERGVGNLKDKATRLPNGAIHELKKFHYDVAGAANAGAISSLMKLVTADRVLFGTDFPPAGPSIDVVKSLATLGFSAADLRAIDRDNAVRLLPRFGG
jgi:6-methylsalicylate decarboxylase